MIIRCVVALVLAVVAPAALPPGAVGAAEAATALEGPVTPTAATTARAAAATTATDSFTEVPLVLPAVSAAGEVLRPGFAAAQAAGTVVLDQVTAADRVQSEVIEAATFQTLGVTWPAGARVGDLAASVRTRSEDGWSEWRELAVDDGAPDVGTADLAGETRGGTDPVWVGDADAVQLSFAASAQPGPDGMTLALIGSAEPAPAAGPGDDEAASTLGPAATTLGVAETAVQSAGVTAPRIISREEWGAAPAVCEMGVASTLVGVVVHHTAGSNDYSSVAQAEQQIRNDQRYHIDGRGWCDIGYNFVVDKWGNIYEGRDNSGTKPVIGVHAGGFNTATVGISMLGNYSSVTPGAAVVESVAHLSAWRLATYYRDPAGTMSYHTFGGENSRFPAGATVVLPVVFGHRDVAFTACPGQAGYGRLGAIRARAHQIVRPALSNPSVSPTSVPQGTAVTVRAGTVGNVSWRLDVVDARTGILVHASIGYAQEALGGVVATWDASNLVQQPVGPGPYRLTLSGVDAQTGASIVPYTATVEVTGSQTPPTVAAVPLTGGLRFVPITPIRVFDTRPGAQSLGPRSRVDVVVAGRNGIPADARAVAMNVTAVHASTTTHLKAWPAGQPEPVASVLNADASRSAAAAGLLVAVGGEGKVSLYNNAGSAHVIADVTGYYTASTTAGWGFGALATPYRALDTRESGGPVASEGRRTVVLAGRGGVPRDARAVVVNVTSVAPGGDGFVAVVPAGSPTPTTSTVNHQPRSDVSNRTTVALADGAVDLYLKGAPANVVLDVAGWYGPAGTSRFTPIKAVRVADTRLTGTPITEAGERSFAVRGPAGLPTDAVAVSVTLTAVRQTSSATHLIIWQDGRPRPGTSDLNTGRGRDQATMAIVGLGSGGGVRVYNDTGSTDAIIDAYGYFR